MLLTEINLAYYQDLMEALRRAIAAGRSTIFAMRQKPPGGLASEGRICLSGAESSFA